MADANAEQAHPSMSRLPDWSDPPRCRDRIVLDRQGRRIGRVDMILRDPEQDELFCLIVIGSAARLGNEARAVPVSLVAESEGDGGYMLLCDAADVMAGPIHVDGSRCACTTWFIRVREHFAGLSRSDSSSGKPPHSSSL